MSPEVFDFPVVTTSKGILDDLLTLGAAEFVPFFAERFLCFAGGLSDGPGARDDAVIDEYVEAGTIFGEGAAFAVDDFSSYGGEETAFDEDAFSIGAEFGAVDHGEAVQLSDEHEEGGGEEEGQDRQATIEHARDEVVRVHVRSLTRQGGGLAG